MFFQSALRSAPLALALLVFLPAITGPSTAQDASDPHRMMLAKSHYENGLKLLGKGQESEGKKEFLEALATFPEFADAFVQLGNLEMRRKDFTKGLERYLQAQMAFSRLQGIVRKQDMERQRQIQENLDVLRERVRALQRNQAQGADAKIEQNLAMIERLEQEQKKMLTRDGTPIPAEVYFLTGNARMNLERFDEAIQDLKQALVLRPNYGEAHNNLAVIYLYRKDYPNAWIHVHAAEASGVRVNPQFRMELAALLPEPVADSGK